MFNATWNGYSIFDMTPVMYADILDTLQRYQSTAPEVTFARLLLLILNLIALKLNVSIIFITLRNRSMCTSSNYALLGLSLTDGILPFIQVPSLMGQLISGNLYYGVDECLVTGAALYFLSGASQWSVLTLAYERYLFMARGITLTGWKIVRIYCVNWTLLLIIVAIPFFLKQYDFVTMKPSALYCSARYYLPTPINLYLTILAFISISMSQLYIAYCYMNVVRVYVASRTGTQPQNLRFKDLMQLLNTQKQSRPDSNIKNVTLVHTMTRIETEFDARSAKKEREHFEILLFKKSLLMIIVFGLCWTPMLLNITYEICSGREVEPWFDTISVLLSAGSACFNPIMNFIMDSRYRNAFKDMFRQVTRSELK